ncbi:hypothetical protein [Natrinema halophilum]|uniref:Uncharacterized protein n=1 Tax=Natrinema halophilum TaxID=1699371 RepID=A0A7D5K473_9EURY|nr:hypothetical protein [Natrinema halophilum]QLG47323.1 hypothetical protein HYG82_00290 [Natrinema halophilum]
MNSRDDDSVQSRDDDRMRVRLEEIRADLETLDDYLLEPLSLQPAIANLEMTLEVYRDLPTDGDERSVAAEADD